MKKLKLFRLPVIIMFFVLDVNIPVWGAEVSTIPNPYSETQLFGRGEPKAAKKARKKQEAKDKKLKKDYKDFVKNNQKRSIEIQTPVVQERMKQNVKDADSKYKSKKKNNASRTKKAGRKYN